MGKYVLESEKTKLMRVALQDVSKDDILAKLERSAVGVDSEFFEAASTQQASGWHLRAGWWPSGRTV